MCAILIAVTLIVGVSTAGLLVNLLCFPVAPITVPEIVGATLAIGSTVALAVASARSILSDPGYRVGRSARRNHRIHMYGGRAE